MAGRAAEFVRVEVDVGKGGTVTDCRCVTQARKSFLIVGISSFPISDFCTK